MNMTEETKHCKFCSAEVPDNRALCDHCMGVLPVPPISTVEAEPDYPACPDELPVLTEAQTVTAMSASSPRAKQVQAQKSVSDEAELACQEHGPYEPWKNGKSMSLTCPICTQRKRQNSLALAGARRTAAFEQRKQEEADRQAREKAEFEAFKASRNEQVNMWVSEGENGKLKVISPLGGTAELESCAKDDGQAESPALLRESDFADYPGLLDDLRLKAKDGVRVLTQHIVFLCKQSVGYLKEK